MKRQYNLAVLPGEGIGPEVVDAAARVLQHVAHGEHFTVDFKYGLIGEPAFAQFGRFFPEQTEKLCALSDGILFGAVTQGGLLELRRRFDLFINLRPVRTFSGLELKSSLLPHKVHGLDILFVRELAGGIYFGSAGRGKDEKGEYGYHTMHYYDWEIRRIARIALQKASERRHHLTVAHKENALPHLPWCRLVQEEAVHFPDVMVEGVLVDNLAMQLVREPKRFDVILAGNLFGDILSDIGGALVGSIGVLGSASLNANGFGLYEAIHGTAPDIAGKGIANPLGTITAVTLMLWQWGEQEAAQRITHAQEKVIAEGYGTPDLISDGGGKLVDTETFTNLLITAMA